MGMLGERENVWGDDGDDQAAISGMMETVDGIRCSRSVDLPKSVASAKREEASKWASRDFREEWDKSMRVPIERIGERFRQLKVSGRPVVVTERVDGTIEQKLHAILLGMDSKYKEDLSRAEDLTKVLVVLDGWIKKHCVVTPYSFSIQKCSDRRCCPPFRTPAALCKLAMERQPTPREDQSRPGHFLEREDALRKYGNDPSSSVDLSDLPSMNTKKKELAERRKALTSRDIATSKRLELKSWDPKKVKGIVVCYHCNKARCFFSREINAEYEDAIKLWQQKMEAIDFRYSCGDLVFEDDHPVSKVLAQCQVLSCES